MAALQNASGVTPASVGTKPGARNASGSSGLLSRGRDTASPVWKQYRWAVALHGVVKVDALMLSSAIDAPSPTKPLSTTPSEVHRLQSSPWPPSRRRPVHAEYALGVPSVDFG